MNKGRNVNLEEIVEITGVSRNTIRSYISKQGFPVEHQADRSKRQEWVFNTAKVFEWWRNSAEENTGSEKDMNLKLRNEKLKGEVERIQIDNLKMRGEIAYVDDVLDYLEDRYTRVRQALRAVPNKTSPLVAMETDPVKCKQIELQEIDYALTQLSKPVIEDCKIQMEVEGEE